jgi:hypothetical protein
MEERRWAVQHRIAGIVFETVSNEPIPGLESEPFLQFSVLNQEPDIRHFFWKVDSRERCRSGAISPLLRAPTVLEPPEDSTMSVGEHWVMLRDDVRNSLEIRYLRDAGEANLPGRKGTEFFITANIRQIFSSFLPRFSAILLHSSGIILGDRAAIFVAPNEGGKTTVVKLAEGCPVLSGDQVILREEDGEFFAYSTPLGGMTSGHCRARVGGLFALRKAEVFRLSPVSSRELLQRLWTEHRNYTFLLPRDLKKKAFGLLSDLCCKTVLREMAFSEGFVGWVEIEKAMSGTGRR